MKAMILAAGLGTRLRPLTDARPKALVEVNGLPLLEINIRRLRHFGIKDIIVNVHHFAEQVFDFLREKDHFGINIAVSDERDQLLDTGGGLKKASWFFDDGRSFLLLNTDILTDLDPRAIHRAHVHAEALATLAVRRRPTSRYLLFGDDGLLCGWRNVKTGEEKPARPCTGQTTPLAFSGLQVIHPAFFDFFPPKDVFSIIDVYLAAARSNPVLAYRHDDGVWVDVGKPETVEEAGVLLSEVLPEPAK